MGGKRVHPGDVLAGISANVVNQTLALLDRETAQTDRPPSDDRWPTVRVMNNSGTTAINRFESAHILEPLIAPDINESEFQARVAFVVERIPSVVDYTGQWVVAQEPIEPQAIGRATVVGITHAVIEMVDETHKFVEPRPNGKIRSTERGVARIVWVEPGVGQSKMAIIMLLPFEQQQEYWARITGTNEIGTNKWSYEWAAVEWSDGEWVNVGEQTDSGFLGLAINTMEDGNSGSGLQGNGVTQSNLDGTGFDLVPIGRGAIVKIAGPYKDGDDDLWLFSAPNLVDGSCPG